MRIWDIWYESNRNLYMLLCYHCFAHSVPINFLKWKLNSAKNNLWKRYHIGLPRLKGGFNGLRYLFEFQIIPIQIPIALYQRWGNGAVEEEQYQINNPTKSHIILYKHWTAKKVGSNATFTTCLPTKTTFHGCK